MARVELIFQVNVTLGLPHDSSLVRFTPGIGKRSVVRVLFVYLVLKLSVGIEVL